MPNQINNARLRRRRAEREPIDLRNLPMKMLLPILLTLLVPIRKLVEGLLNRKVAPLIRHGLGAVGGGLFAKGLIDAEQAGQFADLTDLVMAVILGALALGWSYAEKWAIKKANGDGEKIPRAIPVPPPVVLLLLLLLLLLPACSATDSLRDKGVGLSFSIGTGGICFKPVFGTHADPEVTEGEPPFVTTGLTEITPGVVPAK